MLSKPLAKFFVQGKRSFSAFKSSSVLYQQGGQIPAFKGPTKLFINNKFVDAISGKRFETTNPATGDVITTVSDAQKEDVDVAVKAARSAFETGSEWRKTDPRDRARLLYRFADLLDKHKEELAIIESLDNGKPVKDSLNVDIFLAIDCLRYYAGWADKISGSVLNIRGDFDCYVRREPVGVVGQIIPWNFPILMLAWKLGPALATGCTVVVKPAEQTPLSALKIGELIAEVFPKGVVNILPGQGITAGAPLVKHRDVDKIAFTGSTEVGKLILSEASSDLKRVSLELGGKSPVIVFADADLDKAVHWTHIGLFLNQGQCCIAGSRIYVEDKVYDEFVKRAAEKAKQRIVGNPFDNKTDQGPQVSQEQLETVLNYIEKGKKEGARLVTGGGRVGSRGYFVQPTVFADVKDEMTISKEEIFGPVMGISKFSTLEEAVKRANNHMYGLGAAVFTENLAKAHSVANRIRAGTVYLNCYDIFDASAPFGGYKQSGHGRELGPSGLDLYLEDKTVIVPLLPNSK